MTETIPQEVTSPAAANASRGPWTLAIRSALIRDEVPGWRVQCESPNYPYSNGTVTVMTYRKYEEAVRKYDEVRAELDAANITEETERKLLCSYCKKELESGAAFPEVLPHRPYDIAYCGCGGWD